MGVKVSDPDDIARLIKFRHLRVLVAVVRHGSMIKAAEHLSITQPVVSKAIAELEAIVGVRLLDRGPKGVQPTLYGQALLKRSAALFNDLRTSMSELKSLSDPTSGELKIGCSEVVAAGLLPGIIGRLSKQHPRLTLHVTSGDPSSLLDRDLRDRNIELIIARIPVLNLGEDAEIEILFQDHLLVAAGLENPLIRRRKVTLEEIWSAPWCLPPRESNPGKLYGEFLHACGREYPKRCVIALSVQLQTGLLNTSDFLTLLPSSMLRFSADRLSIRSLRVDMPSYPWPVGIVTLKNRTLSPAAQLFIDCTRSICKPLTAASQ